MNRCKKGYYYCYTDMKCKPISKGMRVTAKYFGSGKEPEEVGIDKPINDNGNGNGNGGNGNSGNGGGVSESKSGDTSLRDWFGKSRSSDGTPGWVQLGGKYAGKPCARQPGQTTKPKCGSSKMKRNLDKDEEQAAFRRKQRQDPNPDRKGKAINVKTEELVTEKKGEKDACYRKVKSRYSVWPSAYASGALVKCRKVGAANWGNKSEEVETFGLGEGKLADKLKALAKEKKKRWDAEGEKARKDAFDALDKVKAQDALMARGMEEQVEFSNWRDDFKATEYEFIDLIKPEPLVTEASFEIKHTSADVRNAERKKKIDTLTQKGSTEGERRAAARKAGTSLPSFKKEEVIGEARRAKKARNPKSYKEVKKEIDNKEFRAGKLTPAQKHEIEKKENLRSTSSFSRYRMTGSGGHGSEYRANPRISYIRNQYEMENKIDEMIGTTGIRKADPDAPETYKKRKEKPEKKKLPRGYVKFYDKHGKGRIIDGKKVYEKFELEVPTGDIKKLAKKAVKRIDTDHDGDVDHNDPKSGKYGEYVPSPDGKKKVKTTLNKEGFSDWKQEFDEKLNMKKAEMGEVIDDFYKSDAPQFKGKSKEKRREMAVAAKLSAMEEDWQKVNKSDKTDGMSAAAVKAYRRENPGSKLKTAVTGDPKPGSKDAKRRKSFCARSKGQQDMYNIDCSKTPDKPVCKARRRWKC